MEEMNKSKESMISNQDYKFDIPATCVLPIMKGCLIEKLLRKYVLLAHPYPLIEGEMIMFQPVKADQQDLDIIYYRDYSLRKRLQSKEMGRKPSSY